MPQIGNHYVSKRVTFLVAADALILISSVYLAALLRFGYSEFVIDNNFENFFISACLFSAVILFSMSALGMYQTELSDRLRATVLRLMPAFALGCGLVIVVFYFLPEFQFGRGILGILLAISAAGLLLNRLIFSKSTKSNLFESRVMFLGCGQLAKDCAELAKSNTTTHRYSVTGFLPTNAGIDDAVVPRPHILEKGASLAETAKRYKIDEIVVAVENRRGGGLPIQDLLECKMNGIRITDTATFFEREACQIRVDSVQPSWFVFGGGFDQSFFRTFCKRIFDLVASIILAVVTLPITLFTALWIFLEDRGPIFYKQERVGKDGKTYNVLKFRSMRINAESGGAPQWASKNDPRVTRIGSIIRKLRIDEIPQIFNVLKGEMSFVGPRPERPFFVDQLCEQIPYYDVRHSVKPGITGMAQVRYAYGSSVEDAVQKLQYDLYYVKNNSLFLDIIILIDTIQVVLLGKGAR